MARGGGLRAMAGMRSCCSSLNGSGTQSETPSMVRVSVSISTTSWPSHDVSRESTTQNKMMLDALKVLLKKRTILGWAPVDHDDQHKLESPNVLAVGD